MIIAASVFAVLAALLHVLFFAYESVLFERPDVHARFRTRTEDVPAVKPWAYNQGFYNLFLAIGALVGAGLALAGEETVGLALILLACGSMLTAALVLVATNRAMARAAATQGTFPLLAVVLSVAALLA
ncbi:epimerase [Cellulomonas sp. Root930]|nr:epimerase [Cellulomonas sp. Root930]